MTVIAWDGKTLAADSLQSNGEFYDGLTKKLYHLKSGAIFGESGMADSRAIINLLDPIMTGEDLPTRAEIEATKTQGYYLLILPDKTVWEIGSYFDDDIKMFVGYVVPVHEQYWAVGHGADPAKIAMSMGKDAVGAVKEACKWSLFCREPVQTMTLEQRKDKIKRVRKPKDTDPVES